MSYDLCQLRDEELIERLPHTNTYRITPTVNAPRLTAADQAPAPPELRDALHTIERHFD